MTLGQEVSKKPCSLDLDSHVYLFSWNQMFPDYTVFTVLSWVSCSLSKHSLESILYKTAKSNSNHQFGAVQFCVNSSVFSAQILLINMYLRMKPHSNTSCHKARFSLQGEFYLSNVSDLTQKSSLSQDMSSTNGM